MGIQSPRCPVISSKKALGEGSRPRNSRTISAARLSPPLARISSRKRRPTAGFIRFLPYADNMSGAVTADDMPERSRELGIGNMAGRRFAFHPDPFLHRIELALAEKRHVVRRVQMLPPVPDTLPERV